MLKGKERGKVSFTIFRAVMTCSHCGIQVPFTASGPIALLLRFSSLCKLKVQFLWKEHNRDSFSLPPAGLCSRPLLEKNAKYRSGASNLEGSCVFFFKEMNAALEKEVIHSSCLNKAVVAGPVFCSYNNIRKKELR